MKHSYFQHAPLYSALLLALGSSPLAAQQTTATNSANAADQPVEVIEIKGIRGSLIRSVDIKREANGVVDAISAEEMGKFPDTNLAESLQRITGVSVSRSNGEGSQITVRGFGPDFNLVTLNGRQMPGTGYTRSYSLENLSAEGVSALEVYKTARADNPSGGLGAMVNIITSKPLQKPGTHAAATVKGIYDSSNETGSDVTPELATVLSSTFWDDKVGVALSLSHQERDFQKQQANVQGWQANVALPALSADKVKDARPVGADGKPSGNYYFAKDMNYSIEDVERERSNGQLTLQLRPVENFTTTLDYTASRAITGSQSIGWGIWNEFGGNINAYELDKNGTALFADISGNDGSFTASKGSTEVKAASIGVNLDWQVQDSLQLTLDYHNSDNKADNGADKGLRSQGQVILGSDQLLRKVYDYRSGEIPQAQIFWKNGTTTLNPGEIDANFSQFIHSPGKAEIEQWQLDASWDNDIWTDIPLSKMQFGIARTDQTMGGQQGWSGLRGGPGFNPAYPQIFPDAMFSKHSTANFLDQFVGGGAMLQPNYYYRFDFDEAVARQLAFLTKAVMGADEYSIDPYYDGIDSESSVNEVTDAIYLQSRFDLTVAELPLQVNLGLRYEKTDVLSLVRQRVETQVNWESPSEWITQYQQGGTANFLQQEGEHDVLLPMFDLKADVTDDVVARFTYGKSISRAPLGLLAGGRSLSGSPKPDARSGSQGNTNLLPFESTNLDVSFEYYYAEGSYAALGYFKKDVDNFIQTTITETTIAGLRDILNGPRYLKAVADLKAKGEQATSSAIFAQMLANGHGNAQGKIEPGADDPLMVWKISQPANTDKKSVDGFEAAVQHLLGDSGFGVGINATFVQGDVEFDVLSLAQQAPLTGLSDSANLQLFYEKDGWSVKVTYAWRDKYLLGVGQAQGSSDAPPQFAETFGQWDVSVNYDILPELTLFAEGINLNNETERGYGRFAEQFLFARQYGPRYTLGMRYRFD